MNNRHILIIDDEEMLLRAWSRLLGCDHRVSVARGGVAGLAALDALPPGESFDAVLLDVSMPDIDGLKVFERACPRFPWFRDRVVFLTGGAKDLRAAAFLTTCNRPALLKPFTRADVDGVLVRLGATMLPVAF